MRPRSPTCSAATSDCSSAARRARPRGPCRTEGSRSRAAGTASIFSSTTSKRRWSGCAHPASRSATTSSRAPVARRSWSTTPRAIPSSSSNRASPKGGRMKIATIGRGNVGGGLAKRWRNAGHEVTELGSDGGDVSGSEAVLVAIPSKAIPDAFGKVRGSRSQVVIDATNAFTGRTEGFESLAHEIKSHVGGPVAKSFNCNYAGGLRRDRLAAGSAVQHLRGRGRRGRGHGAADPRRRLPPGVGWAASRTRACSRITCAS